MPRQGGRGTLGGDRLPPAVLSALSGPQRSRASVALWLARLQNHGCAIRHAGLAKASGAGRADQARDRQRLFQAAFELEDPDQGMARRAEPRSVSCLRLLHRATSGTPRPTRRQHCASVSCRARCRSMPGGARSWTTRRTFCSIPKSGWTRCRRSSRRSGSRRSNALPGDIRSPADFRPSIISSAAI